MEVDKNNHDPLDAMFAQQERVDDDGFTEQLMERLPPPGPSFGTSASVLGGALLLGLLVALGVGLPGLSAFSVSSLYEEGLFQAVVVAVALLLACLTPWALEE
ncbi:MAG: hypothetical protein ACFB9M_10535 [Myxococcota bacterium]